MSYTFRYDGKNDKFEIDYTGLPDIHEIQVSGSAMNELAGTRKLGVKLENDIGAGLAEYLSKSGISSTRESPVFILSESEPCTVDNSLRVNSEMKEICKKYIDEDAT